MKAVKRVFHFFAMLLLLGIIVFLSYAYVSQINTLVTEQTKSHILEVAEQNADAVTQSVQADLRRVVKIKLCFLLRKGLYPKIEKPCVL